MKRQVGRTVALALALAAAPGAGEAQIAWQGQQNSVLTSAGPMAIQRAADGLEYPWGMAFLPDGRLLVTERMGALRIIARDGTVGKAIGGTPDVFTSSQGGLLDVSLDPDFASNGYLYLSYSAAGPEASAATALGRGVLRGDSLHDFRMLFRQEPWITGPNHFGSRITWDRGGHLVLAMGERFQFEPAQDLGNHLGTIVRLNRDGTVPRDNPFVGRSGARPEIWSYGHRNIESAAVDPRTGSLWVVEMGPLGGDELNRPEAGKNYGWPTVSWGINYDGSDIPDPPTRPDLVDAVMRWSPVISPSGMAFYTGSVFPAWQGSALIGALTQQGIMRVRIEGNQATDRELIPLETRIRDVEVGPDGLIYVLTDGMEGELWRLAPLTGGDLPT